MPVATSFISPPLGHSIPYHTPHAVSVSLPTWRDNVGYEEGEKRVVDAMQTGYPRFFVHRSIQRLASLAKDRLAQKKSDRCYLYPTHSIAREAINFLASRQPSIAAYSKPWTISKESAANESNIENQDPITIYAVFTEGDVGFSMQKQYWQHTGDGISSRLAERCLNLLHVDIPGNDDLETSISSSFFPYRSTSRGPNILRGFSRNKHYSKKSSAALEAIMSDSAPYSPESTTALQSVSHNAGSSDMFNVPTANEGDTSTYIEERYARNLPASQAPLAKIALRRRVAGVLKESNAFTPSKRSSHLPPPSAAACLAASQDLSSSAAGLAADPPDLLQPSMRGIGELSEHDVFLYPGGMSAIFHAFMTILKVKDMQHINRGCVEGSRPVVGKSVCFGFPYTDTLKVLQKWGPGCEFFGSGLDSCLESLDRLCHSRQERYLANPSSVLPEDQPILSLFCEFPSNPLLRSPDLQRLRDLADKFGFYIVIDETVGGFVNVECLPFADIVVSSLTKIFSGDSNVMGGSLTLNPHSSHYVSLKAALDATYEDTYYYADALFMERNSRDFRTRVSKINASTEVICDLLAAHTVDAGKALTSDSPGSGQDVRPVLTKVFYPKFITPENYRARLRHLPSITDDETCKSGYGGLFSVTFTSLTASRAFFDALPCCKGPSLGTNFTLACPYTILAHYLELDWAREFEVEEGLVRVSIGLEDEDTLRNWFGTALKMAELAEIDEQSKKGNL